MPSNSIAPGGGPHYTSLRDYLKVVRQQRVLVFVVILLGVGAGIGFSLLQEPVYEAETSLSFRPPTQDVELIGLPLIRDQTPEQRAAVGAEEANKHEILDPVREELGIEKSFEDFDDDVEARAEVRTNLVVITAKAGSREEAARIASAVAERVVEEARKDQRALYNDLIRSLRRERRRTLRGDDPVTELQRRETDSRILELRTTRDLTAPVEVVEPVEASPDPVQPRPVRNGIIGFVGGLILAIALAFLRAALDRRLRGSGELAEEADLPLLAVVREHALGRVHFGDVSGADQEAEIDMEAFRILRMNLEYLDADRPARRVLVTSPLPEAGKSTVAASLAVAAGLAGRETLLVGADLRRPVLAERTGVEPTPGLTDYLAERADPQQVLRAVALGPRSTNGDSVGSAVGETITMLPAGRPVPRPTELLGSQRFAGFMEEVAKAYDLVVLDSAPLLSSADALEIVEHVDAIVLCVRSNRTTRDELRAALDALGRLPTRPTGLVVTGVSRGAEGDYGYYHSAYSRVVTT